MSTTIQQTKIVTFYAAKGGTGRTMALANIAWIMASHGKSVLVVDWNLENPDLHLYYAKYLPDPDLVTGDGILDMFSPLVAAAADPQRAEDTVDESLLENVAFENYDVDVDYPFPNGGRLCYLSPGHMDGDDYAARCEALDRSWFQDTRNGTEFLARLRHRMSRSEYDYILINGRTGLSRSADICTLALPDTVVLGTTLDRQCVEGVREMARRVRDHSTRPIGLHVLPLRVDMASDETRIERAVAAARSRLDPYLSAFGADDLEAYWKEVRVPYQPQLAFGEELAAITQDPSFPHTLLSACVKAARRITDGAVDCFRLTPRDQREEYVIWRANTEQGVTPRTVAVLNHPDDQLWADWISEQLATAGVRARPEPVLPPDDQAANDEYRGLDTDYVVALLSKRLEGTPEEDAIASLVLEGSSNSPQRPKRIGLRVSSAPLLPLFAEWPDVVDLAGRDERTAYQALFTRFARDTGVPPFVPAERTRFPSRQPPVTNLPMRNARFIGRSRQLVELRDGFSFSPGEHPAPQVVVGGEGVGKHELAMEYAHRFASQYDVVWLVPATSEDGIRGALRELAGELNATLRGARSGDSLPELLRDLRKGEYYSRWLLVFDGAEDSTVVEPLLRATGPGHILITSRNPEWPVAYRVHHLDSFTPEESLHLLETGLRGADPAALERLGRRFGHLPGALNAVVSELGPYPSRTDSYIASLDRLSPEAREASGPGYQAMAAVYRGKYDRLKHQVPAAARLLELCSFLSPDGVGMMVIESDRMTGLLAQLDETLQDELRLRAVVNRLAVETLATVDQRTERLKVQRVLQDLVHAWMSPDERAQTQREVLAVLAGMAPSDAKRHQPAHWPAFVELDRHLEPSGALDGTDPGVHRWLISQVYHRRVSGQWSEARALGDRILRRWRATLGDSHREVLLMEAEVAAACRELGQYPCALGLSQHAYENLRDQDSRDVYTLLSARGYAADLRANGRFQQAFRQDQETYSGLIRTIGREHNATLDASNNLALSKFYMETVKSAIDLDRETYDIRMRQFGEGDFRPWLSYANLGTYSRELGDFEASEGYLDRACERFRVVAGEGSSHHLGALAGLGMARVRKGDVDLGRKQLQDAHQGFRSQWGDRHPRTMSCELSLAIALHASGRTDDAAAMAQAVYDRYVEVFGASHPFTSICRNNMAVYLLAAGDAEAALSHAEEALYRLDAAFPAGHRYPLTARLNQSNCRHELGRDTRAEDIGIHKDCGQPTAWGERHPVTLIALANRLASTPEHQEDLRAILLEGVSVFPEEHPLRAALLADPYRRVGADLEVQDV